MNPRMDRGAKGVQRGLLLSIIVLAWVAEPALARKLVSSPYPVDASHWNFLIGLPHYVSQRTKLIRQGYRPLKLQHDDRDSYGEFSKRFPEMLGCFGADHTECHFIFERRARGTTKGNRYLVIRTLGESPEGRGPRVLEIGLPDHTDLKLLWIRRDLEQRGCEDDTLETRDCDPAWLRDLHREKAEAEAKAPKLPSAPDLPPLPTSSR